MDLAYRLLYAAVWCASLAPLRLARLWGRLLGLAWYRLDRRHRRIVLDNLRASFPGQDPSWIERTARGVFLHLGQVVSEIPYLLRWPLKRIESQVRLRGVEHFRRAQAKGRGVLLLTGHLGNWEWASLAATGVVAPAAVVARPIDWPPADRLVNRWRSKTGHKVVPKTASARRILRLLRQGHAIGVLLDQNVDWYDGQWVEFFGRQACTNKGLALLARATGAPVLPFYCFRAPDGRFEVCFGPEVELVKTGDKTKDVWQNTQNYTRALEEIIRQHPEQWFWLHQRWKTRPYHLWPRERN